MVSVFEKIVDTLAEQSYAVIDNFLTTEEVENITALPYFHAESPTFKKAGIGKNQEKQINEAIRGDYIFWLDDATAPQPAKVYLYKLHELIHYINRTLFLSLKGAEVHLTVYPVGSFYKRHLDQFKKDDHRKLSVICYLNSDWKESEGGQLRMYVNDQSLDILPQAGRLVIFRSDLIEHEVLPATRERKALPGGWWIKNL
jgi:SM-20-related protein